MTLSTERSSSDDHLADASVRVGLVVPSSNVTIERELPAILRSSPANHFSFHSSRVRMSTVSFEGLREMNLQRERAVEELLDASVDVLLYGCLVAVMSEGLGAHRELEAAIREQATGRALDVEVLSSAGALISGLQALEARRIALVMPYVDALANLTVSYLEAEGFEITSWTTLREPDNHRVGCIPSDDVANAARQLDVSNVDALVLSACVQMPSLEIVQAIEDELGVTTISAATATARCVLDAVGNAAPVAGAGRLLSRAGTASPQSHT